jgi:RNA-directed DNA polymerase
LNTVVDGKTFDPNKEHQAEGKYGKLIFAERVVRPNADSIDFSGFAPLLDRIVAVLDHYKAQTAVSAAA